MQFSSPVCVIFEPGSCHFRACFVSISSKLHAKLRCSHLISFAEGSEEGKRGVGNKEASLELLVSSCLFQDFVVRGYALA